MKKIDISKYIVVGYSLLTNPLAGMGFLGYVLYTDKKIRELEAQVKATVSEDKEKTILTKDLKDVSIKGNVSNFEIHERCVIENYQNKFYRIMQPSGDYLQKIFLTMADAKKEIDLVAPFLKKPEYRRRSIYNVRYVR
jgi:hypothetical protein